MHKAAALDGHSLHAQVCVIGSGPTGQTAALRLSRAGVEVLLLEAGGARASRASAALMSSGARAIGDRYPDLAHTAYSVLGGTSSGPAIALATAYAGDVGIRLRPLDPVDLDARPAAGLPRWPLGHAVLRAATEEAAKLFGVGSLQSGAGLQLLPDAPGLRSAPFHVADRRMFSEPRLEGVPHLRVVLEAPVHSLEVGADGMVRRAHVRTVDGKELVVEAETFVLAAGTASTCRLLLSSEGAGPRGLANSSGLVGRGLMDHPLVTAGWLTPDDAHRDQLAVFGARVVEGDLVLAKLVPEPELVRRDVMSNCWATLIPRTWSARQLRTMSALRKTGERTDAMRALGSLMDGVRGGTLPEGLGRKLLTMVCGTDDLVHEWLRRRGRFQPLWSLETPSSLSEGSPAGARSLEIVQCVEQLPDDANRLTLTDRIDPAGRRQAQVHWRWSKEDSRREQAFARLVRDSLHAAGLGEVIAPITQGNRHVKQWSAHHLSGGTRMSGSPSAGVVDHSGRCHDHPNLWIAGTSVFPTNGCANPTLSAVATALITVDAIVAGLTPPQALGPRHLHV